MTHWALQYVGKPWARGATGPDAYDCLGLVRHVLLQHYNTVLDVESMIKTNLPTIQQAIASQRHLWEATNYPEDGCIILLAHRRVPTHIGLVVKADYLRCLHCVEPSKVGAVSGVLAQKLTDLPSSGWGRIMYFKRSQ